MLRLGGLTVQLPLKINLELSQIKKVFSSWVWQRTPLILALWGQRQGEVCEFEVSLVYRVSSRIHKETPSQIFFFCSNSLYLSPTIVASLGKAAGELGARGTQMHSCPVGTADSEEKGSPLSRQLENNKTRRIYSSKEKFRTTLKRGVFVFYRTCVSQPGLELMMQLKMM